VAPCFPWFLPFGNRTQNSRVAGASPTTSPSRNQRLRQYMEIDRNICTHSTDLRSGSVLSRQHARASVGAGDDALEWQDGFSHRGRGMGDKWGRACGKMFKVRMFGFANFLTIHLRNLKRLSRAIFPNFYWLEQMKGDSGATGAIGCWNARETLPPIFTAIYSTLCLDTLSP